MRIDPPITYRGALQLLGTHDRPVFDALDRLLGGALLAGPLVGAAALFGWIDQKNEALGSVRGLLDRGVDRLLGTNGYERQQLLTAAHTVLVMSALFEALGEAEVLTRRTGQRRSLTETILRSEPGQPLIEVLYTAPVPIPSGSVGFHENLPLVVEHAERVVGNLDLPGDTVLVDVDALAEVAATRYAAGYQRLAAQVAEFQVWALLGEHAATRKTVRGLHAGLGSLLGEHSVALRRLELLLREFLGDHDRPVSPAARHLHLANRVALEEPIVPFDVAGNLRWIRFPTVGAIHQTPRFRAARFGPLSRPADDNWWLADGSDEPVHPIRDDLDLYLAAHFASPESTRRPLLLLGHPGAGKSLLTKVLAARLPAEAYTVVRVPLRRVDSGAPVYLQVQQALDGATHARVEWRTLDAEEAGTIRVILLDGFDELLQSVPGGRRSYLQDVAEFQRLEAAQGRPVVVVVTSRTIVADRATIPPATPLVRLEEFDDIEVERWLEVWNATNDGPARSGHVRPLTLDTALAHLDLVSQPLLLLMLALYVADPAAALDRNLSGAALYERLFDTFLRREVAKAGDALADPGDEIERRLWRLTIAAFGMFNRGGQYILDSELGADLSAFLGEPDGGRVLGQRTVGEFFFVHASEADAHLRDDASRCYEFLHATFGEYLVARHLVQHLDRIAGNRQLRRVDDDELFALLSHQPLVARRQIVDFAGSLAADLPAERWAAVAGLLERLTGTVRDRHGTGQLTAYRPLRVDRLREMAAYSVNLVTLRVFLDPEPGGVPITALAPPSTDVTMWWRSTVGSWRAGLDEDGWAAVFTALDVAVPDEAAALAAALRNEVVAVDGCRVVRRGGRWIPKEYAESGFAQLLVDPAAEQDARIGRAVRGLTYAQGGQQSSASQLIAWAVGAAMNGGNLSDGADLIFDDVLAGSHPPVRSDAKRWLVRLLLLEGANLEYHRLLALVRLVLDEPPAELPELALLVAGVPQLLKDEPRLLARLAEDAVASADMLPVLTGAIAVADDATKGLLLEAAGGRLSGAAMGPSVLLPLVNQLVGRVNPRYRRR